MCVFMAGKRRTGTKVGRARRREVCAARVKVSFERRWRRRESRFTRMLSQMPWVILASVLAEQGATRTMSAHRRSCEEDQG